MSSKDTALQLLTQTGITLNGPAPTDIHVHDDRLYDRVFSEGSMGMGESYMDGWWDVDDLSGFFFKVLTSGSTDSLRTIGTLWYFVRAWFANYQDKRRSLRVGEQHYDVGNDLYERMLDKSMTYTCGYWSGTPAARNLDEAQEAKLDLVCRKIGLKAGQTVLDVGCGWGSFAKFAAEKYGAKVVGITISKEQAELARQKCQGLDVEIRFEDYRDTVGEFDHIVSLGMFEHVGYKNYRTFMHKMNSLLKRDGLFLLHTIGGNNSSTRADDPWIDKYIFPGGMLPSIAQIGASIESLFFMEDWHNFGADYDKTLLAWCANFEKGWPEIQHNYSERFRRMWRYYLLICAGNFRARHMHLWQIVMSKRGVIGGYKSIR